MRLILIYTMSDGCTYSCEKILPFEYDSEEALIVLFEEKLDAAIVESHNFFTVLGEQLFVQYFYDGQAKWLPEIMNFDHWFELNKRCEIYPRDSNETTD